MFKLSKWLRKSYRLAIEANIRRTRCARLVQSILAVQAGSATASRAFSTAVSTGAIMHLGPFDDSLEVRSELTLNLFLVIIVDHQGA